jgi:LmbE family N-acetylglucosaminyl deacetylase
VTTDDRPSDEPLHVVGVGAHPDDVGVGAGGLLASYVKRGHRATILTVTYGETVRPPGPQQEEAKRIRKREGEDIAARLGAAAVNLERPGNTIIPTWEMKSLLVNALRRLEANVVLFPPPWDTHADHRNLSATMKDVLYYVGHPGMAFDAPPVTLRSAWMYDLESPTEELHQPDLLFDVTDVMDQKLAALTGTRPIFGPDDGPFGTREMVRVVNRFWGLRCGVLYAEPLFQTWGSMRLAQLTRDHFRVSALPLIPLPR